MMVQNIKINKKMITWGDVLAGPLIRTLSYISLNKRPIVIDGIVSFFLAFIEVFIYLKE